MAGVILLATSAYYLKDRARYQAVYQQYAATQAYSEAAEKLEARCSVAATAKEALDCAKENIKSAREPQRSEEDLQAQKEMAEWAYGMIWASLIFGTLSAALTILGILYIRKTLQETSRTANAAVQANHLNMPAKLGVYQIFLPIQTGRLKGEMLVINEGKSTAKFGWFAYRILVTKDPLPQQHSSLNKLQEGLKKTSFDPGEIEWWQLRTEEALTEEQVDDINFGVKGGWKLYVIGLLHYTGELNIPHFTLFCRKFDPKKKRFIPVRNHDFEYRS